MDWIKRALDVLLAFFKWRTNVTDPQAEADRDFRAKHDEWERELRRLEDAEAKAGIAWRRVITGSSNGNSDQLRAQYLAASLALGHHRACEPKRDVPGPQ